MPDISSAHRDVGLGCGVFAKRKTIDAADLRGYDRKDDLHDRTTMYILDNLDSRLFPPLPSTIFRL